MYQLSMFSDCFSSDLYVNDSSLFIHFHNPVSPDSMLVVGVIEIKHDILIQWLYRTLCVYKSHSVIFVVVQFVDWSLRCIYLYLTPFLFLCLNFVMVPRYVTTTVATWHHTRFSILRMDALAHKIIPPTFRPMDNCHIGDIKTQPDFQKGGSIQRRSQQDVFRIDNETQWGSCMLPVHGYTHGMSFLLLADNLAPMWKLCAWKKGNKSFLKLFQKRTKPIFITISYLHMIGKHAQFDMALQTAFLNILLPLFLSTSGSVWCLCYHL